DRLCAVDATNGVAGPLLRLGDGRQHGPRREREARAGEPRGNLLDFAVAGPVLPVPTLVPRKLERFLTQPKWRGTRYDPAQPALRGVAQARIDLREVFRNELV